MKKFLKITFLLAIATGLIFIACKKEQGLNDNTGKLKPVYSTVQEFRQGIAKVLNLVQENRITAYLDTLQNGYPDVHGRKVPLAQFASSILSKLDQNKVEEAVYDVFHFDGATFSLISYLMKARMVGDISAQTLVDITSQIQLPPIPVQNFQPPVIEQPPVVQEPNCCDDCDPKIKIRVTWTYIPDCGNYEKKTSGYAAGNTLTNMSSGTIYRFDAEVTGCPCPGGTWSVSVSAPAGASYGSSGSGSSVNVLPISGGTYTITFTYRICDKVVTKTFTLTI